MIARRLPVLAVAMSLAAGSSSAATLEKLSMDEMISQSTEIVRGRVISTGPATRGSLLYTTAQVQVTERFKGPASPAVEVWIPGGRSGNLRQTFSGAPTLNAGGDYVLFLWAGKSGIRQVIGFSQGAFDVKLDDKGALQVMRAATSETMLDKSGHPVEDVPVKISLDELRKRLQASLQETKK
jgi:hypothetical protein